MITFFLLCVLINDLLPLLLYLPQLVLVVVVEGYYHSLSLLGLTRDVSLVVLLNGGITRTIILLLLKGYYQSLYSAFD